MRRIALLLSQAMVAGRHCDSKQRFVSTLGPIETSGSLIEQEGRLCVRFRNSLS